MLGFLDREIGDAFHYFMRQRGITLRLGEKVEIDRRDRDPQRQRPASWSKPSSKAARRSAPRRCSTPWAARACAARWGWTRSGIEFDDRERLKVNEQYQTNVEHIYAAGDVIGFPALASTSDGAGPPRRLPRVRQCDVGNYNTELFPFGIYAVPEISMVGKTEEQLTEEGIPYEAGIAHYREIARGQLLGDEIGMLKMLIHQDTHKILGVHVIGTGATELIHIGQAVMALDGDAEFFINNVFNFPTLAECYKVAAYNGLNKLNLVYA